MLTEQFEFAFMSIIQGRLESNIVFDSSRVEGRQPIEFTLGIRQVIPGWDIGIEGMCVGYVLLIDFKLVSIMIIEKDPIRKLSP